MGQERQRQRETSNRCYEENQVVIKVNMNPLEADTALPYLGHTIT